MDFPGFARENPSCIVTRHVPLYDQDSRRWADWREMSFGGLLLFGALAAVANIVGGLLLASSRAHRLDDRFLKYLVALGAGFMLAAIFIEIVPATVSIWTEGNTGEGAADAVLGAMALLLAGYLLIQLFEHTIAPHFHFGAETHPESVVRPSAAYTAVGGLLIHTFFDGVSIAAAFLVNFKVGLLVFIAILLHKVPEGFTVASIMLASGRSSSKARTATFAVGAATFLGVISVYLLKAKVQTAVAYALPFSAGVTLYVAASDLIPEVNRKEEKNPVVSVVVFGGVALFYLLHLVIEG
ncbi:MAG TPA: ZIP family metal transporter [Pyrinomonadaceae bacterium]|nr:ZIP family metal transporter [Pyrinomonadaceae bacterium]